MDLFGELFDVVYYSIIITTVLSVVTLLIWIYINDFYPRKGCSPSMLFSTYRNAKEWICDRWIDFVFVFECSWLIIFMALFAAIACVVGTPRHARLWEIKQELIAQHEKNKCPECVYVPNGEYYKWNDKTHQRESIKIDFRWLKCPKLENELKERIKNEHY